MEQQQNHFHQGSTSNIPTNKNVTAINASDVIVVVDQKEDPVMPKSPTRVVVGQEYVSSNNIMNGMNGVNGVVNGTTTPSWVRNRSDEEDKEAESPSPSKIQKSDKTPSWIKNRV